MEGFDTPILFLIFNRPDLTEIVFKRIREVKPKFLFIAADGPRPSCSEDNRKCKETRKVVLNLIDWECEVKTLFRDRNLGCGTAPFEAINWFFDQVNEGIIIEDDCLLSKSFFQFSNYFLGYFKNDERVMMISAFNICGTWKPNEQIYHFSNFGGVWGWATWKRAWKKYDFHIKHWENKNIQRLIINQYFPEHLHQEKIKFYKDIKNQSFSGTPHIWDSQWTFCRLLNSGVAIVPSKNLVKNIGFDQRATHTLNKPDWAPHNLFELTQKIFANKYVIVDKEYDRIHLDRTNSSKDNSSKSWFSFLKN